MILMSYVLVYKMKSVYIYIYIQLKIYIFKIQTGHLTKIFKQFRWRCVPIR